jgi:hypothetical protein
MTDSRAKMLVVMTIGEQSSTHIPVSSAYDVVFCTDIKSAIDKLDQAADQFDGFIHSTDETATSDWDLLDKANIRFEDICWIAYLGARSTYPTDLQKAFAAASVDGAFDIDTLAVTLESVMPSRRS